jgi:PadR family transcriptional regulator, regulatory protein PadR
LKGTRQTIVLKVLKDQGKTYGYEITPWVKELSEGSMVVTEGALCRTLHQLEAEGLLKTERVMIGKRARKCYMLTPVGKSEAKQHVSEFIEFIKTRGVVLQMEMNLQ